MSSKKHRKKLKKIHQRNHILSLFKKLSPSNSLANLRQISGRSLRDLNRIPKVTVIDDFSRAGFNASVAAKKLSKAYKELKEQGKI